MLLHYLRQVFFYFKFSFTLKMVPKLFFNLKEIYKRLLATLVCIMFEKYFLNFELNLSVVLKKTSFLSFVRNFLIKL